MPEQTDQFEVSDSQLLLRQLNRNAQLTLDLDRALEMIDELQRRLAGQDHDAEGSS